MSKHGVLVVVFSACLAASSVLGAEEPTHNDLAEMNATLKEIARALKQQVEAQKGDLLLKRMTFAATQLTNAQERLNSIDRAAATLDKDRIELESMLAAAQKEAQPGDGAPSRLKSQWQSLQDRLSALRQERIGVENDIQSLRREVRDWQTLLDKTLTSGS